MPTTLPLDVYEALEEELGKERARRLVHALEKAVDAAVESKWLQVRDELLARLVTKEEFRSGLENLRLELVARIEQVHAELSARMDGLSARIDRVQTSLEAKIERLNLKMNFVLLLLILLATLWSPPVAELLRKLLGLG
jgi:predicted  nucleic acid-binding Zn-ribbon protein